MAEPQRLQRVTRLLPLAVVAVVAMIVGLLTTEHIRWDMDSATYAMISQELLAGHGFSSRCVWPNEQRGAVRFQPHMNKLPVYPYALAALGGLDIDRVWPGRLINIACHVLIACCVFVIVDQLVGRFAALAAGLCAGSCHITLSVAVRLLTEGVFMMFCITTVCLLLHSRRSSHPVRSRVMTGLAAAGAIGTRHAGLALLPVLLWEVLVTWRREGRRKALRTAVSLLAAPAVMLMGVWVRNVLHTGFIAGRSKPSQGRTVTEVILPCLHAFADIVGFNSHTAASMALAALIAVPMVIGLVVWLRVPSARHRLADGLDVLFISAVSYALLIGFGMTRYQPVYEQRFFAPLALILLPIAFVIVTRGWHSLRPGRWDRFGKTAAAITLVLMLAIGVGHMGKNWEQFSKNWSLTDEGLRDTRTYQWVAEHLDHNGLVVTNRSIELAFFARLAVVPLHSRGWNAQAWLPDDVEQDTARRLHFGKARHLVLFSDPEGLSDDHFGDFIARLSLRPARSECFVKVWESNDGVIYELQDTAD